MHDSQTIPLLSKGNMRGFPYSPDHLNVQIYQMILIFKKFKSKFLLIKKHTFNFYSVLTQRINQPGRPPMKLEMSADVFSSIALA